MYPIASFSAYTGPSGNGCGDACQRDGVREPGALSDECARHNQPPCGVTELIAEQVEVQATDARGQREECSDQ
jgi:hypothetical protein